MKNIIKKVLNTIYYLFLTVIIIAIASIVYNKIKYPESPLTIFKYQIYVDLTDSMIPDLHASDIIITKKCSEEELNVGDIITYREGNVTITHRIIEKINNDGNIQYKTKGDNNSAIDDKLITYNDIEGKYFFKIPYLGFFLIDRISLVLIVLLIIILIFFPYNKIDFSKTKDDLEVKEN